MLGFGPESEIWEAYSDPVTNIATYSIQLAPTATSNSIVESNFTLGNAGDLNDYVGKSSVSTIASDNYYLTTLDFGTVYQSNGIATS